MGLLRILSLVVMLVALGCSKKDDYSQATPEDVLASAKRMVENGHAEKLPNLIYADNDYMRAVLKRAGRMFDSMESLGQELAKAFPAEIEKLKAASQDPQAGAKASSLLQSVTGNQRPRDDAARRRQQEALGDLIKTAFADPFGWLDENQGRLTTAFVSDDTVAVMWDNKPIIPVIGLLMMKRDGKWYFVLPTNVPGADRFLPKTKEEYSIIGSLIKIWDQAIQDLASDVRSGKLKTMDDVGRKAGEKAFLPMVMAFYAYDRMIESRIKAGAK